MIQGSKPRVALVAHEIHDRGGMERALSELIRRGSPEIDFVVLSVTLAEDLRPLVDWHRIRVPRRPMPVRFVSFLMAAGMEIARIKPPCDVVHVTGAIVPNRADLATVHYCHAAQASPRKSSPDGPRAKKASLRQLNSAIGWVLALTAERWCYRPGRLRAFAAVSEGGAIELARHYPRIPISVTPNGVDIERFKPDPDARALERAAAGINDDAVVALFVGGRWEHKGLDLAIDALMLAQRSGAPNLALWVVGRGDEAEYRRLADRLGVGDRVRFLGFRSDLERFYQAADLFVLPSRSETFCLVAYEAAACGLPVIATECNGITDLVGEGEAGILVRREAACIAEAMLTLSVDESLRRHLGSVGANRARLFTWDRSVDNVVELYRSLSLRTP